MNTTKENTNNASEAQIPQPKQRLNTHYIKDMSFENPYSPPSSEFLKAKPRLSVDFDLKARNLVNSTYELLIQIRAETKAEVELKDKNEERSLFLVELAYGGVFTIDPAITEEKQIQQILLVDCATTLFPFARRVIADTTMHGGFQPLLLEAINFEALYATKFANDTAAA